MQQSANHSELPARTGVRASQSGLSNWNVGVTSAEQLELDEHAGEAAIAIYSGIESLNSSSMNLQ